MSRADFVKAVVGGGLVDHQVRREDIDAEHGDRVYEVANGNIVIAYTADGEMLIFAREGMVNMRDLAAAGPGSVVRYR